LCDARVGFACMLRAIRADPLAVVASRKRRSMPGAAGGHRLSRSSGSAGRHALAPHRGAARRHRRRATTNVSPRLFLPDLEPFWNCAASPCPGAWRCRAPYSFAARRNDRRRLDHIQLEHHDETSWNHCGPCDRTRRRQRSTGSTRHAPWSWRYGHGLELGRDDDGVL